MAYRENSAHHMNVCELREILEAHLRFNHKPFKFWCEARLGRLVSRTSEDVIHLRDVSESSYMEFYTR